MLRVLLAALICLSAIRPTIARDRNEPILFANGCAGNPFQGTPLVKNWTMTGGSAFQATIATSKAFSPACSKTAAVLTEDTTASATHEVDFHHTGLTLSGSHTFTVMAKRGTGARDLALSIYSQPSGNRAAFNLLFPGCQIWNRFATGTVVLISATAELVAGGFCNVVVRFTPNAIDTQIQTVYDIAPQGANTVTYTGDGHSSIILWGENIQ